VNQRHQENPNNAQVRIQRIQRQSRDHRLSPRTKAKGRRVVRLLKKLEQMKDKRRPRPLTT